MLPDTKYGCYSRPQTQGCVKPTVDTTLNKSPNRLTHYYDHRKDFQSTVKRLQYCPADNAKGTQARLFHDLIIYTLGLVRMIGAQRRLRRCQVDKSGL
jgi:hypothetical protein